MDEDLKFGFLGCLTDQGPVSIERLVLDMDVGQVTKLWLSCYMYLVLLSIDSKTTYVMKGRSENADMPKLPPQIGKFSDTGKWLDTKYHSYH